MTPTQIAERIILLEGWRAALLALLSGAVSTLALAPFHFFPVLFFTFPILIWLLDGAVAPVGARGLRKFWPAFRTGWLFGFGYFLAGLWWVGSAFLVDADGFAWLLPFAVMGLPAGLALFWGLGTALARLTWQDGWMRLVGLATALTLTEYLRGTILTGFPWNLPGYAFMPNPLMMQSAAVIGTYGMTFLVLFVVSAPAIFAPGDGQKPRRVRLIITTAIGLLCVHLGWGWLALNFAGPTQSTSIKLRLVQPNIDQNEKWETGKAPEIFQTYLDLSNSNTGPETAGAAAFRYIIWPESAFPFILAEQRDALTAISGLLAPHTYLITGGMRREPPKADQSSRVFNSALVLNGEGEIVAARDKTRLVPFGEFLPFQDVLENIGLQQLTKLQGGFAAGSVRQNIALPDQPSFLPLICYEVIYPGGVLAVGKRPDWLVNLTNDAWFGQTSGPYQHAHQTRVRAVEEGIPIVRVANNGISFVSDSYGRIGESLPLNQRAVLDTLLPEKRPHRTVFSRIGNLPVLIFVCILFLILVGVRLANTNRLQ